MRLYSATLGREAERNCQLEGLKQHHLGVKPLFRVGPLEIRPAQPSPQFLNSEIAQRPDRSVESMIFKVEPLANA